MPTYIKTSSPAADGMRLNLLEEKVRNLNPGEAPDLSAVIRGLNRLYEMTMRGAQHTSGANPIRYDLPDYAFWMLDEGSEPDNVRSIVTVTYGDTDHLNRFAQTPFAVQIMGTGGLGGNTWPWEPYYGSAGWKSLAMAVFGSPAKLQEMLPSGADSILRLIENIKSDIASIREEMATNVDLERLEDRVKWLEDHW